MPFGVLFSVFTLALLGGVHCAAMCGGIAIA
ncbi:MAG: sulfite exporter TauE/SafE family protein, partial [Pseudomonadota bacterium]